MRTSRKTPDGRKKGRHNRVLLLGVFLLVGLTVACLWQVGAGLSIKGHMASLQSAVPDLRGQILSGSTDNSELVERIRSDAADAEDISSQPLWRAAASLPWVGQNFSAISEASAAVNDIAEKTLVPLASQPSLLDFHSIRPTGGHVDLERLKVAAPNLTSAANALSLSYAKLLAIDTSKVVPEVAAAIDAARTQLGPVSSSLNAAASTGQLLPSMLGADGQRNYLLMVQNNAELRASGGIPGALAVLQSYNGKLSLGVQSSAADLGAVSPPLVIDQEQQQIYSPRLGIFMQDVNLTPDFPTAAATAQAMWEKKTGQRVDGVLSIDPVALSYILDATGPVSISGPELSVAKALGLPSELSGGNVVPTLLSDVYAKIPQPKLQDAYFAGVAKEVFSALSEGRADARDLITGITRGTEEGRVLMWSGNPAEQAILSQYPLGGSISGPSISPAQFGVYFNDGTGAKMDYYIKRTVQLVRECPVDGYEQIRVRITNTSTAPADAATSLPPYVTGGGVFGVKPGTVQTNIVAYGPVQANIESATVDGQKEPFAPHLHSNRPVGVVAQQLEPGESKTVDFIFGKIVQHTEPDLVVTPTVQSVKDVVLPTENAACY